MKMPYKDGEQFVTQFNKSFSIMFHDLKLFLFEKGLIDADTKWGLTKFCMLRTFFDFADEVVRGFEYSPEMLVELIDEHDRLKTKFENILKKLSTEKQEKKQKVMAEIEE